MLSPPASGKLVEPAPSAAIYGCAGAELTAAERDFFTAQNPLGLILFARNIDSPGQVRALIAEFADTVAFSSPLILIDQEGGRVARLGPPHWRATEPARTFGDLYRQDTERGLAASRLNAEIQAHDLAALGINVNCTPVADLAWPDTHKIIGDRAFSNEPEDIAALGRAVCEGHLAGGVLPVVKHVPGHGRATADSHLGLPVVAAGKDELAASDFVPFRRLADMPLAMTAHIVYPAFDGDRPATQSPRVVLDVIRGDIGFDGLLLSDDLGMKALDGDFAQRARLALDAGCDVALHCSGELGEMISVAGGAGPMNASALVRLERALDCVSASAGSDFDSDAKLDMLAALMAK